MSGRLQSAARGGVLALFLVALAGFMALLLWLGAQGFRSTESLDLWGRALLAAGGQTPLRDVVTAYPPAPILVMAGAAGLAPMLGAAAPWFPVALLAATLVLAWHATLRDAGLGRGARLLAVLLLALNPLFLRALAGGVEPMLLEWGVWMLAYGMFNMRLKSRVNDIILVAAALVLLGASGPFGLVIVLAALPFLALIVLPDLLVQSVSGSYLVILFPLLFSGLGFLFVNWIFTGDPLHFLVGPQGWPPAAPAGLRQAGLALVGVVLMSPLSIWAVLRARRLAGLQSGAVAALGMPVAVIGLGWATGTLPGPALAASLGCGLAAASAAVVASFRRLQPVVIPALLFTLLAGAAIAFTDRSAATLRWRSAALGHKVSAPAPEMAALGRALRGRHDILFSAADAPAAVAERGSAAGIVGQHAEAFQLAAQTHRLTARVLVVRSAQSVRGADGLGRAFPRLFTAGVPGYRLIYDGPDWRVYQSDLEARP